jgi:AGCS family alanine or glycine:cation symporter
MFQSNQGFSQLVNVTGGTESWLADKGWLFGIVTAILVGMVIIGGIKGIARVTSKIVPLMALIYIVAGLTIILLNYSQIPSAITAIVTGAFTAPGISGGVVGVLFQGFKRAAFSNEAGVGTAAIAHSAVKTHRPVTEGLVALYEPFIDSVVVCTVTALVIVITNSLDPSIDVGAGIQLTSSAFESAISWFPWVLTIAVLLFAFSTMISVSYYGLKSWTYLFGEGAVKETVFKIFFLFFVTIGSSMHLGAVIEFSDAMIFAIAFPNLLGCYLLLPVVKRELTEYWSDYKAGTLKQFK